MGLASGEGSFLTFINLKCMENETNVQGEKWKATRRGCALVTTYGNSGTDNPLLYLQLSL
jgi:hypothetical protein